MPPPLAPTAQFPGAAPAAANGPDATAEFNEKLNDPRRWRIKEGVPIFKAHERKDPATGQLIRVDLPKLYRIANNMQTLALQGGVPIRMTLGHTEPGKPETEQPPVGGYYRNARVAPFGPKGEPAVVVDEWLDPQYAGVRKNFPYRSSEYYDDSEQITGVALLTRDPYLDLGVVAYGRDDRPTFYTDEIPGRPAPVPGRRQPTMYRLILGEQPMPAPPAQPNYPAAAPAGYGYPLPAPQPVNQPQQFYDAPNAAQLPQQPAQQPAPTNYGQPRPAPYSAPWPGPAHRPPSMRRSHPSGGAVYAAEGASPMPGGGGPGPEGGPPGGGDPMQQLQMLLMAAAELVSQMAGGGAGPGGPPPGMGPGGPPQEPFPAEEEDQYARYAAANGGQRRRGPAPRGYRYANPAAPVPYSAPMRTLSGRPAGEVMQLEQTQYQLRQANEAIKVLFYERDQSDTEACVSEIQRLAAAGYPVGEYELGELKVKPRNQRGAYLDHIATHYAKVGTEHLPPLLGDPTPAGPDPAAGAPASREEMEAALKMSAGARDPNAFTNALHYIRTGQTPGAPVNRIAGYPEAPGAYDPAAPNFAPADPYAAGPSANGRY